MSGKLLLTTLILGFLVFLSLANTAEGDRTYEDIAAACKWLKENVGYGCDGKTERWIWTTYMRLRYGITDCNSFCVKYHGRAGGQCKNTSNYDTSSWCPQGQTCECK